MAKQSSSILLRRIKNCLSELSCPYLEDNSDQWLAELLLHPSEARMKLLLWIITSYDSKFEEILDESVPVISNRIDSRHQKLLFSLNIMGVCKIDDLELVRGTATQKKQLHFWNNLVDMLYTSQFGYAYSPEQSLQDTSYFLKPARAPTLDEVFHNSCNFVDTLVREQKTQDLFSTEVNLFSPDVESQIKNEITNQSIPSPDMLISTAEKMQEDLKTAEEELLKLKTKFAIIAPEQTTVENYCRKIDLSMKTFSQIIDSFLHCHENEIETWCHKQKPHLSEFGPTVKYVHTIMQNYQKLNTSLSSLNMSTDFLMNDLKKELIIGKDNVNNEDIIGKIRNTSNILQRSIVRKKAQS